MSEAPTPITARTARTSPAEVLFNRKLALSHQLDCRSLLDDLIDADRAANNLLSGRVELESQIRHAKTAIDDAESMAALNAVVDGANESQRKLQRDAAVRSDPVVIAATLNLRQAEAQLAKYDADLKSADRNVRRIELTVGYRCSVLRFLGGE